MRGGSTSTAEGAGVNRAKPLVWTTTTGSIALVAITHRIAPMILLERVNVGADDANALARQLTLHPGVTEAVVLSTCNRTELYLAGPAPDAAAAMSALITLSGAAPGLVHDCAIVCADDEAALHLLRVAAGLESRVIGEVEVLGQIRAAIARAEAAGTAGTYLTSLFRFATAAGRSAQHTTDRALTPSLPRLALDASQPELLQPCGVTAVLGAGAMAATTVAELTARRRPYWVCARRPDAAALIAQRPDQVVAFEDLGRVLEHAAVVICATGARSPLVRVSDLAPVLHRRNGRPLTIIDLSLPRNVEPAVGDLDGVRLLDLNDLVADTTQLQLRRREEIVADELHRYRSWMAGRAVGHLITELHQRVRELCRTTLGDSLSRSGADHQQIDAAVQAMSNKLVHTPTITIKNLIAAGDNASALAVFASFGITVEALIPQLVTPHLSPSNAMDRTFQEAS